MAEILPINFPLPAENSIASYDWTNIMSGLGFQTFYLGSLLTNSAVIYSISPSAFIPYQTKFTKTSTNSGSYVKSIDLTFTSSVISSPRVIYGEALVNLAYAAYNNYLYWVVTLKKGADTIATISTLEQNVNGVDLYSSFPLTIPKTSLKIGDTLTLAIEGWQKKTVGTATDLVLIYDPLDRAINLGTMASGGSGAVTSGHTSSKITIPFKLDL